MTQEPQEMELMGAPQACADALVAALPSDGRAVVAVLDGVFTLRLYRCARTSGAVAHLDRAGAPTKLTGGVQLSVAVPAIGNTPAARVLGARLRPGWTVTQLHQRLVTLITRARDEYEVVLAREAVWTRLTQMGMEGEYALAELGLLEIDSLTPQEAAHALAALARLV